MQVTDHIHLSEFHPDDQAALIEHLNDRDIYERTLRIPYPYREADAQAWFALLEKIKGRQGRDAQWAIRQRNGQLIGGCGFDGFQAGTSHRAEIGYWLAKPFWARGIMTAVVGRLCRLGFEDFGLARITAHVFLHNPASARVLENNGFQQEGLLRGHFMKDGRLLDARVFGLLK